MTRGRTRSSASRWSSARSTGPASRYPNEGWAQQVFGEPDVERLWEAVAFCTRLDEADPVAAWRDHMARLESRAAQLNERSVRRAPLPRPRHGPHRRPARRRALDVGAASTRVRNRVRRRTCRRRRSSRRPTAAAPRARPLDPAARARRRRRRAAEADRQGRAGSSRSRRTKGADVVRGATRERRARRAASASSRSSTARRVSGRPGSTFFDTLYDENATCHIAYGFGIPEVFDGEPGGGDERLDACTPTSWSAARSSRSTA